MPKFGYTSTSRLNSCHEKLQVVCNEAIKIHDFSVLCGHRNEVQQNKAYERGLSKLKWGESKHNHYPSYAVDISPYPQPDGGWSNASEKDLRRFYFLAGVMFQVASRYGIKLRWGGDWDGDQNYNDNTFDDLFHFEIEG